MHNNDSKSRLTSFAPPPKLRILLSNLSIDFSIFFGFHSSQSPTETPLLINQDLGELEGAKTKTELINIPQLYHVFY